MESKGYLSKSHSLKKKLIGKINKKFIVSPIYINDEEFGESTYYPTVLDINIDETPRPDLIDKYLLNEVGEIVKEKYFDFDFLFNVSFSCSKPDFFGKDKYADPRSIWFNVFLGYYEIDVSLSEREYPFGYKPGLTPKDDLVLNPVEILKIGKSDWNYFSNFLYGVPFEEITEDVTKIYQSEIDGCSIKKEIINGVEFDKLTVESFKVISPYQAENGKKLNRMPNNLLWELLFGFPISREEFSDSFIPTNMKAVMYIYNKKLKEDGDMPEHYSTFIFGGTINLDYPENAIKQYKDVKSKEELDVLKLKLEKKNNRFLELQLKEIRKVIPKVLNL